MKHPISPTVDCVFKAILGAVENKNLLLDFLNGVLVPPSPILDVEIINTPNMRQAMAVLERFSEKEANYHLYQARQNALREEKTRQKLLEDALRREEEAVRDKEEAEAKEKRLREILKKAGIDPKI